MTLKQEVEQIAASYTVKKKQVLLVIGLIHQGETHVFHFGDHPIQKRVQPEDVIFEIGSISKVLTTSILASMIQKGQMKLDDSISLYCPHIRKNHPIQIEQLATHTSGLPAHRLLRDFQLCFLPKVKRDMYCQYSLDELIKLLNSKKWNQSKTFPSRYSNVGMGLLGLVMGWSRNKTYEQLLTEYIAEELNLSNTFITIKDDRKENMILGHKENGKEVPPLHMLDYQGAGAIRSTITDLLSFLSAHLNAGSDSSWKMTREPRLKMGRNMSMGLGWVIDDTGLICHNGATSGFSSFMGFRPQSKTGVVVLSNYRNRIIQDSPDRIAYDLMNMLDAKIK
ncbi:serine hydrolase [Bacillus sp. 28A-2]|uniref:serine hydrolase domain-containing protein n=1 Tax=Bacillus sp. 28A-2 TaxID=2772252 RepID=UPI00168D67D4|nr:serine hydrolase [Bacillus sp. 28A-2]MBD3860522.1 serine hydrolase [Bacillus sp. 28A-2]